jgi:hypothetical protein
MPLDNPPLAPDDPPPGDLGRPAVVLALQIGQVLEGSQRQEARLGIADGPLGRALRGRPGRPEHDRREAELAEQGRDLGVEPGPAALAAGDDRAVVVADELLGDPAEPRQATRQGGEEVGHRAAEGEHRRVGARVRQRRHEAPRLAGLAAPDRKADAGLPPVDLDDLARQVRRPLEGPGGKEARPDPRQVVLQDRDPAAIAGADEALPDDRRRDRRIGGQQGRDLVAVRVEERAGPRPPVLRRLLEGQQPDDRGAAHRQAPGDGRLRQALAVEQPLDLGPILHSIHSFLPRCRRLPYLARGCPIETSGVFRFRPARSVQFSVGVDNGT